MDLASLCELCLGLKGVEETTPFGPDTLVFKVGGKCFALMSPDEFPPRVNLKCDPARAEELRGEYPAVRPGYHMNKKHWNTVILDGSLPAALVRELVLHSHQLVVKGLTAAARNAAGL
ncbi:MAG: MmcQ-like protein [Verrucomicrobiales bacterium]|nr:MmcQ-like protein [Verrucomicrobiales bacterium]